MTNLILEALRDLKKQCIVLMGITAAGKSTFVKTILKNIIPSSVGASIINSDIQVNALQYNVAVEDWSWLQSIETESDFNYALKELHYTRNDGKDIYLPITWQWLQENKGLGIKNYYRQFYKPYYATFFDIRYQAKSITEQLTNKKIYKGSGTIVIDTTGVSVLDTLNIFEKTKHNNFTNTIIFLDVNPDLCVERDIHRGKTQGRTVGANVIYGYASRIRKSYDEYLHHLIEENPLIDRILHYKWVQGSNNPIVGYWDKIGDYKSKEK